MFRNAATLACLALALAAGASPLSAQEDTEVSRYVLRIEPVAGQTARMAGRFDASMNMAAGQASALFGFTYWLGVLERTERVEAGRVVEKWRRYERWERQATMNEKPLQHDRDTFLNGRVLRFVRGPEGVTVEGVDEPLEDDKAAGLATHFDYVLPPYPDRPVAVGETWQVEGDEYLSLLQIGDRFRIRTVDLEVQLVAVDVVEGRRLARMRMTGKIDGRASRFDFMAIRGEVDTQFVHDLDSNQPVRVSGRADLRGKKIELGSREKTSIESSGTALFELTWTAVEEQQD